MASRLAYLLRKWGFSASLATCGRRPCRAASASARLAGAPASATAAVQGFRQGLPQLAGAQLQGLVVPGVVRAVPGIGDGGGLLPQAGQGIQVGYQSG